jgi:hypothetical protein
VETKHFSELERGTMKQPSLSLVEALIFSLPLLGTSLPTHAFDNFHNQLGISFSAMQDRKLALSAAELCETFKEESIAGADPVLQLSCSCEEVTNELDGSGGSYHMTCDATCGHLCNVEETVCLIPGTILGFDANGVFYLSSQTYKYTRGRNEFVERRVFFDSMSSPLSCQTTVDEATCQSCNLVLCTEGSPITVQCENIEAGATFDFCEDPNPNVEAGVFEFLNENDFRTCYEIVPTPAPSTATSAPSPSPTASSTSGSSTTNFVSMQVVVFVLLLDSYAFMYV